MITCLFTTISAHMFAGYQAIARNIQLIVQICSSRVSTFLESKRSKKLGANGFPASGSNLIKNPLRVELTDDRSYWLFL